MPLAKLAALDVDDLTVVSAHVQDAVMRVGDIAFRPADQRMLLPLNRFVWEAASGFFRRAFERRRAVLHFDRVRSVRSRGIAMAKADTVLSLLAVRFEPGDPPSGTILLTFAGGGEIRLEVECIEARLTDVGAQWATEHRPDHR